MIVEDIMDYPDYMKCLEKFRNGECFREEFSGSGVTISLEQSKMENNQNFRLMTITYGADALAVPLNGEFDYKKLIQDISDFVRRKHGQIE